MIDVNLMPGVEEDVDAELNYNEDFLEIDGISISLQSLGNVINGIIDKGYIELQFSSQLANDGTPCLVVDYIAKPLFLKVVLTSPSSISSC